jgi:hypothetical protein
VFNTVNVMIFYKTLETKVNLMDPNEAYTPDMKALLLRKLNERYKQICYQSSLVLEVTEILRHSMCIFAIDRDDGSSDVDVQFIVKCEEFVPGEIIHDCKIGDIHTNGIIASNQHASIKLQKEDDNKVYSILTRDQRIPCVVQRARYIMGMNTASIAAVPYMPKVLKTIYYNIVTPLSADDKNKLMIYQKDIEAEELRHKDLTEGKSYKFFKSVMYPFKVNQKYEQSAFAVRNKAESVPLEIDKLASIAGGCIVYPSEDDRGNKRLFYTKELCIRDSTDMFAVIIDTSLFQVLTDVYTKYLLYLQGLRGFCETYPTPEKIKELMGYWVLCNSAKP